MSVGAITLADTPAQEELVPLAEPAKRFAEIDTTTLEAAQHGDPEAFARLFDHYDERLRALAYRVVGDRQLMDDALQEVAIKAFRGLPAFRRQAALSSWLYRITYTTCLNFLRSHTTRTEAHGTDDVAATATSADPADAITDRLVVRAALAELSPEQRALVLLVLQRGYDHKQAATILGIPAGTVASRLFAARARLREALGGTGLAPSEEHHER